jgi:hypothetical protein
MPKFIDRIPMYIGYDDNGYQKWHCPHCDRYLVSNEICQEPDYCKYNWEDENEDDNVE